MSEQLPPHTTTASGLAHTALTAGPLVHALCGELLRSGVSMNIHAEDEMLGHFTWTQRRSIDESAALYLESGRAIWTTLRQILRWRFGGLDWGGNLLDFASGYGRVTRHIVSEIAPRRVWVADVYAGGVEFQQREFGVHGIVSHTDPRALVTEARFDCIFVSSLFTHLPADAFVRSLGRLGELLTPQGILVFSVHDLDLLGAGADAQRSGIVFRAFSESRSLDPGSYGSTWVGEDFVHRALAATLGPVRTHRIARGLASHQDLYLTMRRDADAPSYETLALERAADGFVEHCSRLGRDGLRLSGWAADRVQGTPPATVRLSVDGRLLAEVAARTPRSIADALSDDPVEAAGWEASLELPADVDHDLGVLSVRTVDRAGREHPIFEGRIADALLRSARFDLATLHARCGALEARMAAMRRSKFWRLREAWFALKRGLGATGDE